MTVDTLYRDMANAEDAAFIRQQACSVCNNRNKPGCTYVPRQVDVRRNPRGACATFRYETRD